MIAIDRESISLGSAKNERKNLLVVAPSLRSATPAAFEAERILGHLAMGYQTTVVIPTPELRAYEWADGRDDGPYREILFSTGGERKLMLQALSDLITTLSSDEDTASSFGEGPNVLKPSAIGLFNPGIFAGTVATTARWLDLPLLLFCEGSEIECEIFGESASEIRYALESAHSIFVPTSRLARKVARLAPKARVHRVESAVDSAAMAYSEHTAGHAHPKVGLFSDRIESRALHFLLENIDYDIFDLKIAGALPESEALAIRSLLERNDDLKGKIEFTHLPSNPTERSKLLEDIDILCSPARHYGTPRLVLEAMSVGRLVVASQTGGPAELIQHGQNGFLFRHGDADELGAALCDAMMCLRNDRLGGVREAARATIEADHSLEFERELYLALINEALGEETAAVDFTDDRATAPHERAEAARSCPTPEPSSVVAESAAGSPDSSQSLALDDEIETGDLDDESFVFRPLQSFADSLGST